MNGKALTLFTERHRKSKIGHRQRSSTPWPILERMLTYGCITPLDISVAKRCAPECTEDVAAFICHLFLATRKGHLCISVSKDDVIPAPSELWRSEDDATRPSSEEIAKLKTMITTGSSNIPDPIITEVFNNDIIATTPIICSGSNYYFHKSWALQTSFIQTIQAVLSHPQPSIAADMHIVQEHLTFLQENKKLLPEQAEAISHACRFTFTIITGGPGTGKTHTAGILIKTLCESTKKPLQPIPTIALAAPTGKAAANLEASIAKALKDTPNLTPISGQTLHQLLKINSKISTDHESIIPADIIIVDECSMIDANLMGKLLASIKPGARIILLGDKNQLPSIEAGSLFADMTESFADSVIELITCLRSDSHEIIRCCHDIKSGNFQTLIELFDTPSSQAPVSCRNISEYADTKGLQQTIVKYAVTHISNDLPHSESPEHLIKAFNQFRLLTPLRQGPLGSEALNTAIFSALQKRSHNSILSIIPIMIVKNDYRLNLFNGEVGVLFKFKNDQASQSYAVFPARNSEGSSRKIPQLLLPKYELAYCLSIHKSQGSEFNHVMLLLPPGSETFGREAFYTGASRAKQRLEIWSQPAVIQSMMEKTGLRLSGLNACLKMCLDRSR